MVEKRAAAAEGAPCVRHATHRRGRSGPSRRVRPRNGHRRYSIMRRVVVLLLAPLCLAVGGTAASGDREPGAPPGPWQRPPELGKPEGKVVRVRTEPELQTA